MYDMHAVLTDIETYWLCICSVSHGAMQILLIMLSIQYDKPLIFVVSIRSLKYSVLNKIIFTCAELA